MSDPVGFFDSWFLWRDAMIAAVIGSVLLAYLGVYVTLMRSAFVSAAVSQLAGLGVVIAILVGATAEGDLRPLVFGVVLGVGASALFALPRRGARVAGDALLAIVVVSASAVTLVLARYLAQDYQHVQGALFGDAVVASPSEIILLGVVASFTFGVHFLFRHRFLLVAFDADAARAQRMAARRWGLLLGLTIGLSISVVTRALGALPAFAFSVIPATSALLLTSRMRVAFGLSMALAAAAAVLGYYVSFVADLPTGPTMVSVSLAGMLPGGLALLVRRARA